MKKLIIYIVLVLSATNVSAQIPVVDILNLIIELGENLNDVQVIMQKHNANATEKKGVQNQRRIQLQLQKMNKIYRTINPVISKSSLNDVGKILEISNKLTTDLKDYLDMSNVDMITGFGSFDTDLANMDMSDWFEYSDYDIIEKLSTSNNFEENISLLNANYQKQLNIEKFAAKFNLEWVISSFQLADEYELRAVELDNLLNGESMKLHTLEGMNVTLMDIIPDLMSLLPSIDAADCEDFKFWTDSLDLLNAELEAISLEKEDALAREDFIKYEKLVYQELLIEGDVEYYQTKISYCNQDKSKLKKKIKEQAELAQDVFDEIGAAMQDLGLFDDIEELESEPDLNVTDGERIELMEQRDQYFKKAMDLRNEATKTIHSVNQSSSISNDELKRQNMQRFTKNLIQLK